MRLGVLNAELSIFTIEGLKELEGIQEKYIKVQGISQKGSNRWDKKGA